MFNFFPKMQLSKIKSILFCAVTLPLVSFAADKALLETLVQKNVINAEEAATVLKNHSAVGSVAPRGTTEKLRFYGAAQTQYHFINVSDAHSDISRTSNGFQLRRVFLGAYADLGNGMSGVIDLDLCAGVISNAPFLNAVFFSKKIDEDYLNGTAYLGYLKVNFAIEEYHSAIRLLSVDRSIITRYFTIEQRAGSGNVGFGSAYTGLYWNGRTTFLNSLGYGFAVTNSQNYTIRPHTSDAYGNSVNIWADIYYDGKFKLDEEDFTWRLGVNAGYGNQANTKLNSANSYGEIWGVNPYVKLNWNHFTLWSELVMTGIENGRASGTQNATPFGVNVWLEKTFDLGDWGRAGPILRYSYLNTDGRGARVSDCLAGAANIDASGDTALNLYDTAQSFSAGINWYLLGHNLKVQAAYEWAQFDGCVAHSSVSSKRADANIFRIQLQVIF